MLPSCLNRKLSRWPRTGMLLLASWPWRENQFCVITTLTACVKNISTSWLYSACGKSKATGLVFLLSSFFRSPCCEAEARKNELPRHSRSPGPTYKKSRNHMVALGVGGACVCHSGWLTTWVAAQKPKCPWCPKFGWTSSENPSRRHCKDAEMLQKYP